MTSSPYVFNSAEEKAKAIQQADDLRQRLRSKAMEHLTQPEPINHNELKRLLIECFDEVFDSFPGVVSSMAKERVARRISWSVLDGDDS